ncbi:excinuclease ABC subunit UvrA [Hydrogenophaga sp.]|uniref:excinuclease ABC subunit UvrA n=1 Tax=Hydrogenophaga sp. TaxID=1904254 RepID=UPI002726DB38|nr:excinuclease ABC subunit UvrA [Hydrogenophaga sp.]MDO9435192.1 excinuclease ABC subunit UvrA [Hydrogenophaga sp.]
MPAARHPDHAHPTARFVSVRGAREHNLKNVDVDAPRNALVVFTGISGSGKSSLAFGTIYAEAQRRYFDSVSPYARRLIDQVGVPDVDSIDGLPPAVALQQARGTAGSRSTLGSVSMISNMLRMLYSRAGLYPPDQAMLFAEDFSPHTPQGACPVCQGLGFVYDVTEASMVPDDTLTIRERAIAAWPPAWHGQNLRDILVTLGYDIDTPWRDLPRKDRNWILFTGEQPTVPVYAGFTPAETRAALRRKMEPSYQGTFTGVRKYVRHTFATTNSELMKRRVARFMSGTVCPACGGKRLKAEALSVTFAGLDIGELSRLPLAALAHVLEPAAKGQPGPASAPTAAGNNRARRTVAPRKGHEDAADVLRTPHLSEEKRIAAQRIAQNVLERVRTLQDIGLGYLSLDRQTPTLSSGELQRVRLATQIHANLFGVLYVLDEPSAGLHPSDGVALLAALDRLKQAGNSLFVVEHDLAVMKHADWIVDVGPDAGENGGHVLYSGPLEGLRRVPESHTARHLFAARPTGIRDVRTPRGWLKLKGVTCNNLQRLDAAFPIGVLTTVTGVSGSGKSSLVGHALVDLMADYLGHEPAGIEAGDPEDTQIGGAVVSGGRIEVGAEAFRRLVRVDQKPIGRTPRSNLATYTGLFDAVRKLFAAEPAARSRRWGAGRFSFNVQGGRCETCEGEGFVHVELLFMPSVYAPCSTCGGRRYNEKTLQVTHGGKNIAEVLAMTVEQGVVFFEAVPTIHRPLKLLQDIGLGYLRLGQPATELSGGEAQRIKLATELQRPNRGDTLYVLDEPTTGLHPTDVDRLMAQLHALVDAGNTVVMVEHDMRVVAESDWVIDVGPGAGQEGGRIVVAGVPRAVAADPDSPTALHLAAVLGTRQRKSPAG